NVTDGAMIIDAMDLLYTGRLSSFCLVSSDSDFTRLAARIREQGVTVYGFGERKTNNAFIAACDKFMYFDVLSVESQELEEPSRTEELSKSGMVPIVVRSQLPKRPVDFTARAGIRLAISNTRGHGDKWVNLADIGKYLRKISPDLHARNYDYERLREFVEASGIVDVKYKNMGDKPPIVLVCLKEDQ
ncbi:NYN multi-domain protein, partial [Pyrenophora tritici-repentis]